jgi:hypothetical protein
MFHGAKPYLHEVKRVVLNALVRWMSLAGSFSAVADYFVIVFEEAGPLENVTAPNNSRAPRLSASAFG